MQQIGFDPGIKGFVKAHRHPSGSALVMVTDEEEGWDWISVFWVKRLAHNAKWVSGDLFGIENERTIVAAERCYDYHLSYGPPAEAIADFQRKRVYDWEDEYIGVGNDASMTWDGCKYFLGYVWERVGKGPQPELTDKHRFEVAVSLGGEIYLPPYQEYWSKPVILHEIAHELKPRAHHGPAFVSTYMGLVSRFLGMDARQLRQTAIACGVRFK